MHVFMHLFVLNSIKKCQARRVFDFLFVAQNVSTHSEYDLVEIFIVESARMLVALWSKIDNENSKVSSTYF